MQNTTTFLVLIKLLIMKTKNRHLYFFKLAPCIAILMLQFQLASAQTTYYVKAGGNDNNNGLTMATAVKTIQRAVDLAGSSGDRIEIKEGTFYETVNVNKDNLTITNYDDGDVHVTAFDQLTTWTLHDVGKNIWKINFIPDDFDANGIGHLTKQTLSSGKIIQFLKVFANGQLMKISRYPNMPDQIDSILSPTKYGNPVKVYEDQKFRFYGTGYVQNESFYDAYAGAIFQAMIGTKFTPVQGLVNSGVTANGYGMGECLPANTLPGWQQAEYHFFPSSNSDRYP